MKQKENYQKKMQPIGIFDSGIGGLTIFREIRNQFPSQDIIYLGDTARLPYGTKSKDSIIKFSRENVKFLLSKNVKLVIVACNTASALAIDELKGEFDIPIIGVIALGAKVAAKMTKTSKIGIIGTIATIKSNRYVQELKKIDENITTISKSCPMFVPIVENGYENHQISNIMAREYLDGFKKIDTLILGCTHYPVLEKVIKKVIGDDVVLIDSGKAIARYLKKFIACSSQNSNGSSKFYVTDNQENFACLAKKLLNDKTLLLEHVHLV